MKRVITAALILSFVAIAVFGFLAIGHGQGCIATLAQGSECRNTGNPFAVTFFHLDSFKGFSTAVFNDASINFAAAFATVLLVIGAWGLAHSRRLSALPALAVRWEWLQKQSGVIGKEKFSCWLALHENSPSAI